MSIGSPPSERVYIFIPSGSATLSGVPTFNTIRPRFKFNNSGEYVLFVSPRWNISKTHLVAENDIKLQIFIS
jgi:hypothetical protein